MAVFPEFNTQSLLALAEGLQDEPHTVALCLLFVAIVSDDLALITGSLLVSTGIIPPELAIPALIIGIFTGDVCLYLVGYSASSLPFLERILPLPQRPGIRQFLEKRRTPMLFFSRFLPGTRMATYISFGYFRLSLTHFMVVIICAGIIWVNLIVWSVETVHPYFAHMGTLGNILAGLVIALLAILIGRKIARNMRGRNRLPDTGVTTSDLTTSHFKE